MLTTKEDQLKREQKAEREYLQKELRKIQAAISSGRLNQTPFGSFLMKAGFDLYVEKIQEYFKEEIRGKAGRLRRFIQVFSDDPREIALLVLVTLFSKYHQDSNTLRYLSLEIGKSLFKFYENKSLKKSDPKLFAFLGYEYRRASSYRKKRMVVATLKKFRYPKDKETTKLTIQAGALLIKLLEKSGANIIETYIDRSTLNVRKGKQPKTSWKLRLTEEAIDALNQIDIRSMILKSFSPKALVYPPKDWDGVCSGGQYSWQAPLIIPCNKSINSCNLYQGKDLSRVYPVINKLQQTPFRINKEMYKLIKEVFERDLAIGEVVTSTPKHWWEIYTMPDYNKVSRAEYGRAYRERQDIIMKLDVEASKRLSLLFMLATAEELLQYDKFWYAYQLDYRGRIYPNEAYLNLQKGEIAKALLEFGKGEYLTTEGEYWLKIHIANTYGLDKQPYSERLEWVHNNYDLIMNVATEPLIYRNFWEYSDAPYEFVAACKAYKDHLEGEKAYLPIALDATCSGIQMYSGLLRDKEGAKSVNVIGNTRQDIYSVVAQRVNEKLISGEYPAFVYFTDSEGVERSVSTERTAKSLEGKITRKIVKRPTMTVPYSVSKFGMSEQIFDELKALEDKGEAFWEGETWVANKIITDLTYDSIYEIVEGARKGQHYLVELSRLYKQQKQIRWTTPKYNFPVIQESSRRKDFVIRTVYGTLQIKLPTSTPNSRKQSNMIAPNFIHSIDSTILMGVIERATCHLGTIHDAFLIHPNYGGQLQEWYKESFIEVMESDPLRQLQQQLDPEEEVPFPEYGELDLNEVRDSEYIIS